MKHRLEYLDSIRGLAALLVVLHHAFEVFLKHNESAYPGLHQLFESVNLGIPSFKSACPRLTGYLNLYI